MEYKTLNEIATNFRYGRMPDKSKLTDSGIYPVWSGYRYVGYYNEKNINKDEIVVVARGVGGTGDVKICKEDCFLTNLSIAFNVNEDINPLYVYYYYQIKNLRYLDSGSAQSQITINDLKNVKIPVPSKIIQDKIVEVLNKLDQKIDLNNKINNNLLEQIKSIYNEIFTQYDDYKRLDEISNVTIGKTPPRTEQKCFSKDKKDIKWISISDLGRSGMFVLDTSEKLTKEAVEKYNVKVIPKDTVLLSFKLTVGRTGFTTENMTTNEAIAHFELNNKELNNYLYCYLTYFNYSDLGSTSSIATAINSKIVKSIKIGIPTEEQLEMFNKLTLPIFNLIKSNEKENIKLSDLRDTLLPKLMIGEIGLDNIEI